MIRKAMAAVEAMSEGGEMGDRMAVGVAVSSPAWAILLSQVNLVLTTVSLVAGLAFLYWRYRRERRRNGSGGEG